MTLKALATSITNLIVRRLDERLSRPTELRHRADDDASRRERDESFYWGLWLHRHW